jgi:predicted transcriptional regulator
MNAKARELLKQVETWSEADQEELLAVAREIESRRTGVYQLSDDERAAVRKGLDAARRGEFAPDDEIEALYQQHRKA